jgi:hypothetical protein
MIEIPTNLAAQRAYCIAHKERARAVRAALNWLLRR